MGCGCGSNKDSSTWLVTWSLANGTKMTKTVSGELYAKAEMIGKPGATKTKVS